MNENRKNSIIKEVAEEEDSVGSSVGLRRRTDWDAPDADSDDDRFCGLEKRSGGDEK